MRISVALHTDAPPADGNQRTNEARYGRYNRGNAVLIVDPASGAGTVQIARMKFNEVATDPEVLGWFSLGVAVAPPDQGGTLIISGPITPPINADVARTPLLAHVICGINNSRLVDLGLVVQEPDGSWREKTEAELQTPQEN